MVTLIHTLKSMIRTINTPSNQHDWVSWAGNQGTHIFLGMAAFSFIGSPVIATMLYIVLKEGRDVFVQDGSFADSLTDSFYFGTGAMVMFAILAGSSAALTMLFALVLLVVGSVIRAHLDKLTHE